MTVMQMYRMDGQVAFVNGAGRGIGAASALALAEAGADVAIRARTLSQLEETAAGIRAFGRRALVIQAVEEEGDDVAALDKVVAEFGALHALVNVVGGTMPAPFMRGTDKKLNDAFDFNVTGPIRMSRAAVPHMLAAGHGSIVMITTTMAHLVARGFSTYGMVKAALDHGTKLLAADLAPRIRVNAVAPGSIHTESLEVIMRDPEVRKAIEDATPLRRLGVADDIAAAVLYLCSPASSYMTGQSLHVDGGLRVPNFDMGLPDL
ncbi:MAG: short-chain dehydrogenase [Ilumatobacteraceae bacterium]|nr:short-chain dehydrogenase [Ilumatobacteraceae bacterium]